MVRNNPELSGRIVFWDILVSRISRKTYEYHRNLSHNTGSPGRDWNVGILMHDAEVLFKCDSDLICVLGGTDGKTAAYLPKGLIG